MSTEQRSEADPKGLIREAYRIEGITGGECRSIFLDWALGVPQGVDPRPMIEILLECHGNAAPDHPMTQTLRDGLASHGPARRRGGRAARISSPK